MKGWDAHDTTVSMVRAESVEILIRKDKIHIITHSVCADAADRLREFEAGRWGDPGPCMRWRWSGAGFRDENQRRIVRLDLDIRCVSLAPFTDGLLLETLYIDGMMSDTSC